MKKFLSIVLALAMVMSLASWALADGGDGWTPTKEIRWVCPTKAGSAGDNFTRKTQGVIDSLGLFGQSIVIDNIADGGGAVAWRTVKDLKAGDDTDHTIMTLSVGDLVSMHQNTELLATDYRIIATIAQDRKFLYVSQSAPFDTFEGFLEYLKDNDVILGGGKGDDNVLFSALDKLIDENDHLSYLPTGDTAGTLTAVLGDQVYLGIGKLSNLKDYLESGEMKAIAVEGEERMTGLMSDVPTFSELGYEGIDFVQTRCVVGSSTMSDEAYAFYCDVFSQVAESEEFATEYAEVYQAIPMDLTGADAQEYFEQADQVLLDSNILEETLA